ncbi:hypothetical protein JW887_03460 [Candidatus Dojkabacteria bacterium]|nr:hypothetical protein [Candidatus Dojkabacteria bacterium]
MWSGRPAYALLLKVFVPFINYIRNINPNCDQDYEEDQNYPTTKPFAQAVINNRHSISLGSMYFILNSLNDGNLIERSRLMSDFHLFIIDNFSPYLYNSEFLAELNELLNKFRNKSAHISTISRDKASDCKFLVRKILARFLSLV